MSLLRSLWIFRRANYRDAAPLALKPAFPPDAPTEQNKTAQGREARATLGLRSTKIILPLLLERGDSDAALAHRMGEGLGVRASGEESSPTCRPRKSRSKTRPSKFRLALIRSGHEDSFENNGELLTSPVTHDDSMK